MIDAAYPLASWLGAVVVALAIGCFRAAPHPAANAALLDIAGLA